MGFPPISELHYTREPKIYFKLSDDGCDFRKISNNQIANNKLVISNKKNRMKWLSFARSYLHMTTDQ